MGAYLGGSSTVSDDAVATGVDFSPKAAFGTRGALVHGSARGRIQPSSSRCQATTASESGIPSPYIRLRTFTAILTSVACAPGIFARSPSPTRRL